ncbi:MAG: hypothetical protein JXR97_15895 [Planctomycetes bacterium]|nr:hypothetical protein [Planctomycetota bacterium]
MKASEKTARTIMPQFDATEVYVETRKRLTMQLKFLQEVMSAADADKTDKKRKPQKLMQKYVEAKMAIDTLGKLSRRTMTSDSLCRISALAWNIYAPALSALNKHELSMLEFCDEEREVGAELLPILLGVLNMAHRAVEWGGSVQCMVSNNKDENIIIVKAYSPEMLIWGDSLSTSSPAACQQRLEDAVENNLRGDLSIILNKENNGLYESIWMLLFP